MHWPVLTVLPAAGNVQAERRGMLCTTCGGESAVVEGRGNRFVPCSRAEALRRGGHRSVVARAGSFRQAARGAARNVLPCIRGIKIITCLSKTSCRAGFLR